MYIIIIAAVIIILLNVLLLPAIEGRKVQTTDYSTFLTGVEKDYVKTVEIQDDYIYYVAESDGQEGYFRTVKMNDPDLVDRLHDAMSSSVQQHHSRHLSGSV